VNRASILYLAAIENPARSALFENQVVRLLEAMRARDPDRSLALWVGIPAASARRPRELRDALGSLAARLARSRIAFHRGFLPLSSRSFYLRRHQVGGFLAAGRLGLRGALAARPDVIHARSYPAARLGFAVSGPAGPRVVVDTRGMYPEEGIIAGRWREGDHHHRDWVDFESRALRDAAAVVNVSVPHTERLRDRAPHTRMETIPTVVDTRAFPHLTPEDRAATRARIGLPGDAPVIVFAGSFSRWRTPGAVLATFAALADGPAAPRLLVLTRDDPGVVRDHPAARGLDGSRIQVLGATPAEVPPLLAACDLGLLVEPRTAISPVTLATKTGEYLAAGLPVLVGAGSGGAVELVTRLGVGGTFDDAAVAAGDPTSARAAGTRLLGPDRPRPDACRDAARHELDVDVAAARYLALHDEVPGLTLAPS